ncbi:lysozyme inhibitor LprI family protein [Rhizobium sp. P28RR-XV]|uniref:lysozyme inhibitor LprI family protein n=1 Tax=Rhizobium sp. P28RR-XV TaxID=2726737 RepID=UPI00145794D7|nr:lysozyme inhibitor LprI family protein [Rhizobium sp. P28RR-XV]NLR89453.1 DUF1311 domain-containing protein [Rhizobium sp. P28RR-XV]
MPGHQSTTKIRLTIAGLMTLLGLGIATPTWAIDCTKASDPIDKKICGNADLKAADTAMGQAYAALLKTAPDPEVRAMLINSQRRWIAARNKGLGSGSDGAAIPVSEIRRAIAARTARLSDRSEKGLVAQAQEQRRFLAKYTGGVFAGFDTRCEFIPNDKDQSSYAYQCYGAVHVRNKDRLCSLSTEWATWSLYEYHAVSTIEGDKVKASALCSDQSGDICGNSQKTDWTRAPGADQHLPLLKTDFPKLDVEGAWPLEESDATWFGQCLTSPTYPPAQ